MEERKIDDILLYQKSINEAIRCIEKLDNEIKKSDNALDKAQLILLQKTLKAELQDIYNELIGQIIEDNPNESAKLKEEIIGNPANAHEYINNFIKIINDKYNADDEQTISSEIAELLAKKETKAALLEVSPIVKALTNVNKNIASYGADAGQIKILKRKGGLTPAHADVFNTAIKAYRNKKVTKDGYIVLTENQAIKLILGTTGTPSQKQKKEFREAWEDMRNESITYETSETLADILGVEKEQIDELIPGIKQSENNVIEEFFIQGLKVIKRQTVNGKSTDIYLIKPCDIIKKCLDAFPWYEEISQDIQRIQYIKNDKLINWPLSEKRRSLRYVIYTWVYNCIRARANGKMQYELIKPYEDIFAESMLDVSHRQEKARRIENIAIILDHLKRNEVIKDWEQYTNKTGELRGIKLILYPMELK